ncbi:glycosyltransferase [Belliella sp. DSM 107340]|uniref:Glycosyltransferase n=1 Tax=Belliella calami TaxID=2923436 RepID=A0ABS9UNJ7_9BACT|nr:glycosyltransferase [Belliella calami]MCH7398201.1 glycosyltransferase [Belliella calami]
MKDFTSSLPKFPDFKYSNAEAPFFSLTDITLSENGSNLPEILFVTSFPPRECGIATYTQDLVQALKNQFGESFKYSICALESAKEQFTYEQKPKFILNTDNRNSYAKIAFNINRDNNVKLVVIQHEFGLFASELNEFNLFIHNISKPIVFVFHTVLPNPAEDMRRQVLDMAANAASIIVMTKSARDILVEEYTLEASKITVIPHGTHLISPIERNSLKVKYNLEDKNVLSTFGLLGKSKCIETTLNALPAIVKNDPNVMFLVLGKTHPNIVKEEGEKYRDSLIEIVRELKLEKHVRFVNEYLPLPILLEYLQLTDVYLFTSNDPNQAVSGTFSYAVSSGCPVVSTPIPHAKEVLSETNGLIVDFENPHKLAKAVISLLGDEKLRAEISSNSFHKMASTAWQNSAIAHTMIFKNLTEKEVKIKFSIPKINLNHIRKMTTDFGMIQFSKVASPDLETGYTLDDNARALIAICQHYQLYKNEEDLFLINKYLKFVKFCMQFNGEFLNYVNDREEFSYQNYPENLEDSNGRAIWALGFVVSLHDILPKLNIAEAEKTLEKALPHLDKIHSTRAMAFIIKGLYYQDKKENKSLIQRLGNRLVKMYAHEKSNDWHWFESYLTYGNSLLPEALLCAYLSTNFELFKVVAKESFEFLLSKIFIDGKIKVISNKGWHVRNETSLAPVGGEQPIDIAYTIMALEKFYHVFGLESYSQKAKTAFNWFLGDNHLNQIVYNPCTGGCYDGIEEFNVNLNQGAESTLSYLMGRLAIKRLMDFEEASVLLPAREVFEEL